MRIPVTVFTGFLGAGKTTIIINIIKQMPPSYKLVMLKNEFGNVEVDSKLMQDSNIKVTEMLNGCLCCILVGKLGNALEEIISKYSPDHILIETSGSAYPAPIAWEIDKMKAKLKLDGIITVIDAKNFSGYRDTSYTAKIQAQYTDLILINKHEGLSEQELDKVLDDVYDLNSSTPKLKTDKGKIPASLIFGLNSKLLNYLKENSANTDHDHMHKEVEIMELITPKDFNKTQFSKILDKLPKWDFYRIKGVLRTKEANLIVNFAFGDYEFIKYPHDIQHSEITFMGKNFKFHYPILLKELDLTKSDLKII